MPNKEYNITHTQMGGGELKEDLGGGSSVLTPATADTLGGVKIGNGISVTEDGTISAAGGSGGTAKQTIHVKGVNHFIGNYQKENGSLMLVYFTPADKEGHDLGDMEDADMSNLFTVENFDKNAILRCDKDINVIFESPLTPGGLNCSIYQAADDSENGMILLSAQGFIKSVVQSGNSIDYGHTEASISVIILYSDEVIESLGAPIAFVNQSESNLYLTSDTYTKE